MNHYYRLVVVSVLKINTLHRPPHHLKGKQSGRKERPMKFYKVKANLKE